MAAEIVHARDPQHKFDMTQVTLDQFIYPFHKLGSKEEASEHIRLFYGIIEQALARCPDASRRVMRLDRPFEGRLLFEGGGDTSKCCLEYDVSKLARIQEAHLMPHNSSRARVLSEQYLVARLKGLGTFFAHRLVCFVFHGPPPDGNGAYCEAGKSVKPQVVHTCGNRRCLNPLHLSWGTAQLNRLHYLSELARTRLNDVLSALFKHIC